MAAVPGVRRSELGDALRACRTAFVGVGLMSCMINLLYLTGSIFMLEVYDRVLPSRSIPTLVGLIVLASCPLYGAGRARHDPQPRSWGGSAPRWIEALNKRVFDTIVRLPLLVGSRNEGLAAAARSRQCPLLPRRHGPERVLRPAVAAALSRHLLRLPRHDRRHRTGRRHHPGRADAGHRVHVPPAGDARRWALPPSATISPRPAAATPKSWCRWAWPAG